MATSEKTALTTQAKAEVGRAATAAPTCARRDTECYDAAHDAGSLAAVAAAVGAGAAWSQLDPAGSAVTGRGIGVALLDSGVNRVGGLDRAGQVVTGPDLSFESGDPATHGRDTSGHGTHLAGIIAACDPVARDAVGRPVPDSASQLGIAPDARVFAMKLATAHGRTDVDQVIGALDWLTEHGSDPDVDVRVVNLAFGTDPLPAGQVDPLAAAARRAWRSGLVVVVSGGNDGNAARTLTNPAIDPFVIAVGSSAPGADGWRSPVVSEFSNGGTADRHVDVLAPGTSITSLRNPGSVADIEHPEGLVAGDRTGRLFRGSGTSQAAAVVAGAAALLLQANPSLTPDQVKAALVLTARRLPGVPATLQGAGQIDVAAAVRAVSGLPPAAADRSRSVRQPWHEGMMATGDGCPVANGGGRRTLDGSWAAVRWTAVRWTAVRWTAVRWTAVRWTSVRWTAVRWTSVRWTAVRWTSVRWTAVRWTSVRWTAVRWTSVRWTSVRWTAVRWTSVRWT